MQPLVFSIKGKITTGIFILLILKLKRTKKENTIKMNRISFLLNYFFSLKLLSNDKVNINIIAL